MLRSATEEPWQNRGTLFRTASREELIRPDLSRLALTYETSILERAVAASGAESILTFSNEDRFFAK